MEHTHSVLMVTSEIVPFAKTGGLADAVGALSAELRRQGNDVRIILPRYYPIDLKKRGIRQIPGPLGVPMGYGEEWVGIWETELPGSGVPVYFVDHEGLYGRDGIYGTRDNPDFADNPERFALLCRTAFQLCRKLGWYPEVMHAHDWTGSLAPVYLAGPERAGEFAGTASVLTIHNLGYQGVYPRAHAVSVGLTRDEFLRFGLESAGNLNLLKGGIRTADIVTTVSPTYAAEIQTPEYGFGLDGLLRNRSPDLFGILNGMDYEEWNPESDPLLPHRYSHRDLSGKAKLKELLQREAGLTVDPEVPVIGIVSRLADQKGFGALAGPTWGSLWRICSELDLQVVILGTGEAWCERELSTLASKLPNLAVFLRFDNRLAHLIEAGSDFFLMPSAYEPCGLNQLYSLRYGTLPIVRHTGGLADTVENYDPGRGSGTGFVFNDLTPEAIFDTVRWAVETWSTKPEEIEAMRVRAMLKRFSWEDSAARYMELYTWALDRRRGMFPRT